MKLNIKFRWVFSGYNCLIFESIERPKKVTFYFKKRIKMGYVYKNTLIWCSGVRTLNLGAPSMLSL